MASRFPVWYLFSVVLSKWMCISAFGPSLSPSNSIVILFVHSAFSLCFFFFWLPYFSPKSSRFLLHQVVGMFSRHLLPAVGRISFRCFGMSCFVCIVLPFVDIFLIFASIFWFISSSCTDFFLVLPYPFCSYTGVIHLFYHFGRFLSAFPVEIPILVLIFSPWFLRGSQLSYKLISPLHRLVNLFQLYYSLIYMVVLNLIYSFLS